MSQRLHEVDSDAPVEMRRLAEQLRQVMRAAGYRTATALVEGSDLALSTASDALGARKAPSAQTLKRILAQCGLHYDAAWATLQEEAKAAEARSKAERRRDVEHAPGGSHPHYRPRSPHAGEDPAPPIETVSLDPPAGDRPANVRGRDELLEPLTAGLTRPPGRVQVLHGLGGCGKTTIALRLAEHALDRGIEVYWIRASGHRLGPAMRRLARRLGADPGAVDEAWGELGNGPDLVWRLLNASPQPWLLVFDNVDQPELAAAEASPRDGTGWIRASRRGSTVVTTRVGDPEVWGAGADCREVDVLSARDGADVLIDLAGRLGPREDAERLSTRLGGLPLALHLAGAYLRRSTRGAGRLRRSGATGRISDFASYLAALHDAGIGLLDRGGRGPLARHEEEQLHRQLISRTWELTLDLVDAQGLPEARTLMRLLSCFGPEPLPVDVLDPDVLDTFGAFPADTNVDRLDRALEALEALSLLHVIEMRPGPGDAVPCLSVHRLVLEANAAHLRGALAVEQGAIRRTAAELLCAAAGPAPEEARNWPWWTLLDPHVTAVLTAVAGAGEDTVVPALRAGLRGYAYQNFAERWSVSDERTELLTAVAACLDADHEVRLSVRHRYALVWLAGNQELEEFRAVLAAQRELLGADHPETLITHHNVAQCLVECGETQEGIRELRAVLDGRLRVLGPADPYTMLTFRALSKGLRSQDRANEVPGEYLRILEEAVSKCRDLVNSLEERGDTDFARYRAASRDLVDNLDAIGRTAESADVLGRLSERLAAVRTRDDPELLRTRDRYAHALDAVCRHREAVDEIREVLAVHMEISAARGGNPVDDGTVLGVCRCAVEIMTRGGADPEDVRAVLGPVLDVEPVVWNRWLSVSGTRRALDTLSVTGSGFGFVAQALAIQEQLYALECDELGPVHPDALSTRRWVAILKLRRGLVTAEEARLEVAAVLDTLVAQHGEDHGYLANFRRSLTSIADVPVATLPQADSSTVADPAPREVESIVEESGSPA